MPLAFRSPLKKRGFASDGPAATRTVGLTESHEAFRTDRGKAANTNRGQKPFLIKYDILMKNVREFRRKPGTIWFVYGCKLS